MHLGKFGKLDFWRGKRVLVTGHTGFKGTWFCILLQKLGCRVTGISDDRFKDYRLFESVKDNLTVENIIYDLRNGFPDTVDNDYDFVFHFAAQSVVSEGHKDPFRTYSSNILNTVNSIEKFINVKSKCIFINVTSDKCYFNLESKTPYPENSQIGGLDHYSASKACCEIINTCYQHQLSDHPLFTLISVRAGNVIGGGDWTKDRLVPDLMRHIFEGKPIKFRNLNAVRPWQHVIEPLTAYLKIAQSAYTKNIYKHDSFNIGPLENNMRTVGEIVNSISGLHKIELKSVIEEEIFYETSILKLDITKILSEGYWTPLWDFENTILKTYEWYRDYNINKNAFALCLRDIEEYGENYAL